MPRVFAALVVSLSVGALLGSCATPVGTAALVTAGVGGFGARTPAQELEQTYYIGVFDPMDQLPPAVYRLTVRGQASAFSQMRFASGWAPALMVDGLNQRIDIGDDGRVRVESTQSSASALSAGRRLMMFGPEGFREAPKDHRLVIVMGSNPEKFFQAVGESLETVVKVQQERLDAATTQRILEEAARLREEQHEIDALEKRLAVSKSTEKGA